MSAPDDIAPDLEHPTWLDGLAAHLHERGFGTWDPTVAAYEDGVEWPIFLEWLPAEPDALIALFGYGGSEARVGHEPAVQFRVRGGTDPRTSRRKAEAIRAYFHELAGGVLLGDGSWLSCAPNPSGVISHGRDANHRHEHLSSHRLTIDPPEASS